MTIKISSPMRGMSEAKWRAMDEALKQRVKEETAKRMDAMDWSNIHTEFIKNYVDMENCEGATEKAFNIKIKKTEIKKMLKPKTRKELTDELYDVGVQSLQNKRAIEALRTGQGYHKAALTGNAEQIRTLQKDVIDLKEKLGIISGVVQPKIDEEKKAKKTRRNRERMFNKILAETNKVPTMEQVDAALKIIDRDL